MGSVKDLIMDDSLAGKLYRPPTTDDFGLGAWKVSGRFSVMDFKKLIPPVEIKNKAHALTMTVGAFFEWFANQNPDIQTSYVGVMDKDGKITDTSTLLQRGELSDIVVMRLAHTPDSFFPNIDSQQERLDAYRKALASGQLLCGVSDVESIFRRGLPLGSSVFENIFKSVGRLEEYKSLATYDETVAGLERIRELIRANGIQEFQELQKVLLKNRLTRVPNPGHMLDEVIYNDTTKFEQPTDRRINDDEAQVLSGFTPEEYARWKKELQPRTVASQVKYCEERNLLNGDGKEETIAYKRRPLLGDFACTMDENRIMIVYEHEGQTWAIPSNKEIQRAIFRKNGVDAAKLEAQKESQRIHGDEKSWQTYFPRIAAQRGIDLMAVAKESCDLMAYAVAEVGNRTLGQRVFDTPPIETWAPSFLPYASKLKR